MKRILGISAYYHDSAAALLIDGEVVAAAQEERFSRVKHDADFPTQAIRYCLLEAGLGVDQLDAIVFYEKPYLKFERILETFYAVAPKGFPSFLKSMPRWVKEQLLLKQHIRKALVEMAGKEIKKIPLLFSAHHLSHAASAFYPSPFEEAAILTIDGVGEWATTTLGHGTGNRIEILQELHFPHSVGLLYSAFTYFLGFRVNADEYKLMGLSAYGNDQSEDFARYSAILSSTLADVKEDGSLRLNQQYFAYAIGVRMLRDGQWEALFGLKKRAPDAELTQQHADLALAIQRFTEAVVLRMAREAKRLTGASKLCLAGGVALNGVANGRILEAGIFEEIFVQPASGDAGGALGAALAAHHLYGGGARKVRSGSDGMAGALLGPAFSQQEIRRAIQQQGLQASHFEETTSLVDHIAPQLAAGKIVGWFQGRMEYGPRALGNRSILADARDPDMQRRLNLNIKKRESFRPFAPIVMEEDASQYVALSQSSPYMNLVAQVKETQLLPIPQEYLHFSLREKLAYAKSRIPAVTHVDMSARVQTVAEGSNKTLYALLRSFRELTGIGLLVNTSFNGRDEPIVCSPEDAIRCFLACDMDLLVLGDFVIDKQNMKPHGTD